MLTPQLKEGFLRAYDRASQNQQSVYPTLFPKGMALERACARAGGLLVAGTDPTGAGGVVAGFANQRQIELLVEAGFTPLDAISIATLNGAKYLGRDARIGSYPFWSPDSRFVAFFADGKLKKMAVAGEAVQIICDAALGRGGSWNRDDVIIFTPEAVAVALYRVSASGGVPTRLTELDPSRRETTHRWPLFLPDGRHFLFVAGNFSGETEGNAIYAGSLDSPQRTLLTSVFSNVAYSPAGFILYVKANHLVAQAFDAQRLLVTGEPTVVADEVAYLPSLAYAAFSTSNTGMLVYQASSVAGLSELTWFDRAGRKIRSIGDRREYANPRVSPDGKRVAVDVVDPLGNVDIFVVDPASGQSTRFTFDAAVEAIPIWSPDGGSIAYQSFRDGPGNVYRKVSSGAAPEAALLKLNVRSQPSDWSPDGAFVVYNAWSRSTGWDLWLLPIAGEREPRPFLQTKFDEDEGQFSPDGRWMAYTSNEKGRREVYVAPFPGPGGKWQISSAGGAQPRWRRDGRELFYLSPDHKLMAVDVRAAATFLVGSAAVLFQMRPREMVSGTDRYIYDVSLDGRQFLVNATIEEASPSPVSIVLDWAADLTRKE